jgi:hypothetical protein
MATCVLEQLNNSVFDFNEEFLISSGIHGEFVLLLLNFSIESETTCESDGASSVGFEASILTLLA